uniref:Uncharacterized protein eiAUOrf1 n=2 Tax=Viruses TaxID=10239 RepID=E7EKP0_9CAUD|nr:unknown [Edwardsiella phage eiAU]ADV36501.1 unknown [Edwardsiella phage eiMSLS]
MVLFSILCTFTARILAGLFIATHLADRPVSVWRPAGGAGVFVEFVQRLFHAAAAAHFQDAFFKAHFSNHGKFSGNKARQ